MARRRRKHKIKIKPQTWALISLLVFVVLSGGVVSWFLFADASQPDALRQAFLPFPEDQPAANPAPAPAPPPKRPVEIPARVLARGILDFPFLAYETFGPGRLALAAPAAGGNVAVAVAEFKNGDLQIVSRVEEPMGEIRDLTRGNLLNNGQPQAVVTTEKGYLTLLGTDRHTRQDETGLERIFIGDWDNDGRSETAFLRQDANGRTVSLVRFEPDGKGAALGSFSAPDFPEWSAVLDRPGKPSLLMGAVRGEASVQVAFYSLDPISGMQATAHYTIHIGSGQEVAAFAAGDVTGRPTLAVSFQAARSYLELFDTAAEGMPSRGRITLPDNDVYVVIAGTFTGQARSELLAITPLGRWILYGLD